MKTRVVYLLSGMVGLVLWSGAGCPGPNPVDGTTPGGGSGTQKEDVTPPNTLTITLFNDSCGTYIAPKFAVCPKGMLEQPHHFVEPPPVIVPGTSVTYTTDQIAGATDGDCSAFPDMFTVGLPGWGYGPTSNPDAMTYVDTRFVGFIGTQFHCGDTINLHWSNCDTGSGAGHWTSEVIPSAANPEPTAPFGTP